MEYLFNTSFMNKVIKGEFNNSEVVVKTSSFHKYKLAICVGTFPDNKECKMMNVANEPYFITYLYENDELHHSITQLAKDKSWTQHHKLAKWVLNMYASDYYKGVK